MIHSLKILNLLNDGNIGGIETLCLNAAGYVKHNNTYLILWKGGKISDEMISRGYEVEIFNTSVLKYLKDSIRVVEKCRKEKVDFVICQGNNILMALCTIWIHIFCKKIHVIGYVHSSPDDWNRKTFISANIIFKFARKIICISDYVLNSTKKRLGFDDKLVRIYNGVDLSKFQMDKKDANRTGCKLIYVGRLTEKKGVQIILYALTRVSTDYQFAIIGDGDYRPQLEKLANTLGLDKNVTFYGSQFNVRSFLLDADIFIHVPILEEGFGLTVVEAMAAGLLCICSKSGALPEIVEDGVTGYLIDKNMPDELASAIQKAIENYGSEEIKRIRFNATNKAKEYSIETYSAEMDKLADEISIGRS